ncbi:hypothetical protein NQ314_006913 [Rhamnusium bicolor]|uniref:Transmembrane protein 131 n=1 Tax=Rhamnusium bicolor TaxID=1586634 RepID=A0AAV8YUW2_9CUCU|nr:hypothetical protein NQ314_006913 [Rhamnusium bicolor]
MTKIVEIYSSGGDFHLELPTGQQEGPNDMWEIPPQHMKAIIRVRFQAKVVQNHTAYVRIKLNKPDEILVVPLEVEVTSVMGIFHPQGSVDFGMGGSLDAPKEVKLCLYNPLKKYVRIHSVSTISKAIKVHYYNVRLQPSSEVDDKINHCNEVGSLTVDWKTAYDTKDYSGKIIIKYRNGKNRSEIPYHITVLKGGISYDPLTTTYFINDRAVDLSARAFKVKNDFDYHLKIIDITFPQDTHLYFKHNLKSNHYAIMKVVVTTSHVEGQVWGDIYIETQFENLNLPVHFKIASGKLEIGPDRLVFDQCFPAKICSHPLRVHSTYNDPMIIEDIITLPPDKRISSRHTGHILARTSKVIGHLFLNPDLECQADCYTGLQTDTSGVRVSRNTVPILLRPGQSHSVLVGFYTYDPSMHSALLFLRNNLTILEVVRLRAQGAFPLFKFGNRKPGSLQPLSFDMTDKHLRDCERQKQYSSTQPNLTVKRTFTARNIGDVTVYVNSFHINDFLCEGYGFKVIDCEPFILPPNGTRKIDIAFTPDLTLTKITRTLILGTSLNIPVNYTLYTTIPATYLNLCAELIMRPTWEIYLSYLTITFMLLIFIIIVLIAVMDAERIKKQAMGSFISPNSPSVQPVLDLRLVGQQTREEIQSTKAEVIVEEEKDEIEDKCEEDKALQKDLIEEVKPKLETERYTVLVPTTGKTKKKLGKRNSSEPSPEGNDIQVHERPDKKRDKVCEIKQKRDKREDKEEVKKNLFHNKKHTKNTNVPAYEEETSSTTTDSSCSNNEDPEKENNQRNTKVCSKLKLNVSKNDISKTPIEENRNHITEVKHVSFTHNNHNKVKHQKSAPKTSKTNEKQNKDYEGHHKTNDHHSHGKHHSHLHAIKKREKAAKDRKDKNMYHKKGGDKNKHGERQPKISESDSIEKRKKSNDVVARSENAVGTSSNSNRPLTHSGKQTSHKPTMYVEPYKQTSPVELGPIGSRRMDRRSSNDSNRRSLNEDNHRLLDENFRSLSDNNSRSLNDINRHLPEDSNYMHANNLLREPNNSFFTNSDEIRLESSSREGSYLEEFASISGGWNHQQNLSDLIESNIVADNSNNSMEAQPTTSSSQSAGYLWGSSSVWQPWAPETPRTPTRTPPGFDEFLQRKRDEQPQPSRESYSPFNTSNIWTQQQSNPWNYSQGQ